MPIGTLYPGLEHVVLDPAGLPCEDGELCVRGAQRFPGYLDPANNAGRVVAYDGVRAQVFDGSEPVTDDLWYCTGDRVARHQDGQLGHLGRLDQQVKVRGYRVELDEIEAALRDQPDVRDAWSWHCPGADGESDLEAVCTGPDPAPERLLAALRPRLPAYMVPRGVTVHDELPLNANGKVDRKTVTGPAGPVGCTVTAVMSLSVRPPALLVSLAGETHAGTDTGQRSFAVSVLSWDARHLARQFATGTAAQRFAGVSWLQQYGVPVLTDASVAPVCDVSSTVRMLDHTLVAGTATWTHTDERPPTVLYGNGQYEIDC